MDVHISIDDVWKSLRYIIRNQPDSIFDLWFYGTLKKWHDMYGAKFTCYCIVKMDDFSFFDIPYHYKKDFADCSHWLRFGFHSCDATSFCKTVDYMNMYDDYMRYLRELKMGETDFLRLHSWLATDEQRLFLASRGIKMIHYPNDDEIPYDSADEFCENGLLHKRTRVWLEKTPEITEKTLHIGRNYIGVFTHEWCFDEQKNKMETAIQEYKQSGYCFI